MGRSYRFMIYQENASCVYKTSQMCSSLKLLVFPRPTCLHRLRRCLHMNNRVVMGGGSAMFSRSLRFFRFWSFFRSGFQFLRWITGFLILMSVSVCGFSFFWQLVFGLRKKCLRFFGFYILFEFSGMVTAVLRISGDESRVIWGPISWSSFWALIWCKWLKSLELASWIWA